MQPAMLRQMSTSSPRMPRQISSRDLRRLNSRLKLESNPSRIWLIMQQLISKMDLLLPKTR